MELIRWFFKKILFNRLAFILAAMVLQFSILINVILRFNEHFTFFYGGNLLLSVLLVWRVANNRSNPVYKIAWIVLIFILPIFGALFYIFFGGNKLSRRTRKRMKFIEEKTKEILAPYPKQLILDEIELRNQDAANQSRYIQNYSYYPPYKNTICEYLPTGEKNLNG